MDADATGTSITLVPEGGNMVSFDFFSILDEMYFHLNDDDFEDEGKMSKREPATLVLFRVRFFYFKDRRLESVNLMLSFSDSKKRPAYTPRVIALWPNGDYILDEDEFKIKEKHDWSFGINAKPPGSPVGGDVSTNWKEINSDKRVMDRAWLTGGTRREGKTRNRVNLFTAENKNSGVVPDIRVSVLLQHQDEDEMELCAKAKISAEAGTMFRTQWRLRNLYASGQISPKVFTP